MMRSAAQTLVVVGWQGLLDLKATSRLLCDIVVGYLGSTTRTAAAGNIFLFLFHHGELTIKLMPILVTHTVDRFEQCAALWGIVEAAELKSMASAPVSYRFQYLSIDTLRALGVLEGINRATGWRRKQTAIDRLTIHYQGCGSPKSHRLESDRPYS